MTFPRTISGFTTAALFTTALVGCTNTTLDSAEGDSAESETIQQPILGGQLATGDKYRAVGALVHALVIPGIGFIPFNAFCSATLVGPNEILTARHCTPSINNPPFPGLLAYFTVGDNAYAPDEYIPIAGFVTAPPSPSPSQGLLLDGGRDIAVAYLESSPATAIPAQIGEFERSMLGSRFEIAGYGYNAEFAGLRYAGLSTASALEGHWYSLLFDRNRNDYLAWYFTDADTGNPTEFEANTWWSLYKLEPTYELFVGGGEGDAVGCFGDSGGPMMLGDTAEELTLYGVGFATEASKSQVCALGNAFVPFYNKDIKDFVAAALGQ